MFGSQPFGGLLFGGSPNGNPSILSVLRINPNAQVAITGSGFGTGASVMFGTAPATEVTVVNGTRITCQAPSTLSTVITVTNTDGSSATFTAPTPILAVTTHVGALDATGVVTTATALVVTQADLSYGYQRVNRPGTGRYLTCRLQHTGLGQRLRMAGLEIPYAAVGRRPSAPVATTATPVLTVTMDVGSLDNSGNIFAEATTTASADLTQGFQRLDRPGTGRYLSFRLQHAGTGQRVRVYGLEIPFADIGRRDR